MRRRSGLRAGRYRAGPAGNGSWRASYRGGFRPARHTTCGPRDGLLAGCRVQDHRVARLLIEVELLGDVAELLDLFADRRPPVRAPVGLRIEPLTVEEAVLDQLEERVEAQGLVIDVALLGVGTDHQ